MYVCICTHLYISYNYHKFMMKKIKFSNQRLHLILQFFNVLFLLYDFRFQFIEFNFNRTQNSLRMQMCIFNLSFININKLSCMILIIYILPKLHIIILIGLGIDYCNIKWYFTMYLISRCYIKDTHIEYQIMSCK